jgi:hypothetical protein
MNPYLAKLRGLSEENLQVTEPSKPSKPSFDGFEGEQCSCVSGNEPVEFEQGYYRNALAALRSECPELLETDRWQQAVRDAETFLSRWGEQAQALGWTVQELFGLHPAPERPAPSYRRLSRYDSTGLIWLLQGRPIVALTDTEAVILARSGASLTYRRPDKPASALGAPTTTINSGGYQ